MLRGAYLGTVLKSTISCFAGFLGCATVSHRSSVPSTHCFFLTQLTIQSGHDSHLETSQTAYPLHIFIQSAPGVVAVDWLTLGIIFTSFFLYGQKTQPGKSATPPTEGEVLIRFFGWGRVSPPPTTDTVLWRQGRTAAAGTRGAGGRVAPTALPVVTRPVVR